MAERHHLTGGRMLGLVAGRKRGVIASERRHSRRRSGGHGGGGFLVAAEEKREEQHSTSAKHPGTLANVSSRVHAATLVRVQPLAEKVLELELGFPEPVQFRPGQFLSVRVGADSDGNPILRSYSIASSPGHQELRLIVKIIEGGTASSWLSERKAGDRIELTGPMGFFVVDLAHAGDVVFGATGVGIAPVLPMLDEVLARNERGKVRLYWGNRHVNELFWQEELEARKAAHPRFDFHLYITGQDWPGRRGRILGGIAGELPQLERPTFYLVGNGGMIRDVKAALIERGVDRKKQIRNEAFFD
jgi:ferredoxin-NADP reductase